VVRLLRRGRQVDQDLPCQGRISAALVRSLLRGPGAVVRYRAGGLGGRGEVPPLLALQQPQGLSGRESRGTQRRLLGDVLGVRRERGIVMGPEEIRLPPGYRLDRSDPDVWALCWPEGWVVAHFSARGVTKEAIEAMIEEAF
jgi:hypothetical protein